MPDYPNEQTHADPGRNPPRRSEIPAKRPGHAGPTKRAQNSADQDAPILIDQNVKNDVENDLEYFPHKASRRVAVSFAEGINQAHSTWKGESSQIFCVSPGFNPRPETTLLIIALPLSLVFAGSFFLGPHLLQATGMRSVKDGKTLLALSLEETFVLEKHL